MSVKPGQTLGQYRIIEQIGRGGMATVYRAAQPSLSRQVAIKILPEFFTGDPQFHDRFKQEAMAVASLRHSNILTVFDSGEADGIAYMVTELVDGGTLASRLGKPLPIDECLRVAGAVAAALDYAHARGMIHRDVKPGNVLLTSDGTPILADFGLAHMMATPTQETITRLTVAGTTIGTPEYMAPEQITNSDVGPGADVYALAVTIYEMLTGAVPYHADTPLGVILARMNTPLPRPRARNPELTEHVETALLKGLATDPADRYPSAGELVRAIQAAHVSPAPSIPAIPPIPPPAKPDGHARMNARTVVIGVASAVVVVAIALALVFRPGHGTSGAATPPPAPAATIAGAPIPAPPPPAGATTAKVPPAATGSRDATIPNRAPAQTPTDTAVATTSKPAVAADGLPPHGRLLYSMASSADAVVAAPQQSPDNTITAASTGFDFRAAPKSAVTAVFPISGLRDFVAVIRFVGTPTPAWINLRFHTSTAGIGHTLIVPAHLRLSPTAGSRTGSLPPCCQPFDVSAGPPSQHPPSLLEGPEPMGVPAAGSESVVAVAVSGPRMSFYADGQEIGRASDASYGPGGMFLNVSTDRLDARVHLNSFEVYAPAGSPVSPAPPALPAHGPLLVSLERALPVLASMNPGCAGCAIEAKGGALEITATNAVANVPLPVTGVTDFVARITIAAVAKRPELMFKFHKATAGPEAHVVQLPAFLRVLPPDPGGAPSEAHGCCHDFDIYNAPLSSNTPALLLGNTTFVGAPAAEPQTFVVTSMGPLIVVYSDGREIGRANDTNYGPGNMLLQVQARGRDQAGAVLRLSQLEIFAAK